jgi:orotate phosphoribosyltransferase
VVDDVVASGASILSVILAIQAETGLTVAGVQSIANWNFP